MLEDQRRDADGRRERDDVGRDEEQRRDDRAQQQREHDEDDEQDRRHDDPQVALARLVHVEVGRGVAADERVLAHGVEVRRAAAARCPRPPGCPRPPWWWPGRGRCRRRPWAARPAGRAAAARGRCRRCRRPGSLVTTCSAASASASGTTIWIGVADPAGKCSPITRCAMIESVSSRKVSSMVEPLALNVGANAAAASRTTSGDHPGAPRVPADEVRDPPPQALGADDVLGVHVVELGGERPEHLAAEEQQDRREEGQRRQQRARDAEGADRPRPEVLRSSASSRQSRRG